MKPVVFTPEPKINNNTDGTTTEPTTEPKSSDKGTQEEQPDKDKSSTTETNKNITTQTSTDPPKDDKDGGSSKDSNSKTPPGTGNVYYAIVDIPAYNPEDGDIHRFKIEKRVGNPETDPYALNFQFNPDGSIKSAYLDPSDRLNNDTYFNGSTYEELAYEDDITAMGKLGYGYNSKNKRQNLAYMNWADYFYSPEYMDGKEDRTDEREEQERQETRDNLYEISHREHKPNTYYRN